MSYFVKTTDNSGVTSASGSGGTQSFGSTTAMADPTAPVTCGSLQVSGDAGVVGNIDVGKNTRIVGDLVVGGSVLAAGNLSITAIIPGLKYSLYSGYYNGVVDYITASTAAFAGAKGASTGYVTDFGNLQTATADNVAYNDTVAAHTVLWTGYFYTGATGGGSWTFSIVSDDSSHLWIGDTATAGYTAANALVRTTTNGTLATGTISLLANTYYPMRAMYGDAGGSRYMQLSFTPPGGAATTNGSGYYSSRDATTTITPTVFKYLGTVTSPVQTQLTTLASAITTNAGGSLGLGYQALLSSTGTNNTAIGYQASHSNVGGSNCASIGWGAGYSNEEGLANTAVGSFGLYNSLAGSNTAVGVFSLFNNVEGSNNTAIGFNAASHTRGSNNTCLGDSAGQAAGDTNAWNYSTAVGAGAITTASNQVMLGRSSETVVVPGMLRAPQSVDPVSAVATFSATPTFNMAANGMVYSMTPTAAMTAATFSNIPSTPASSYSFSFILQTSTVYYIKPTSISVVVGGTTYSATLVGLSNVVLPASYTYLIQTITIVATGTAAAPAFIAFTSVGGY